MEYGTFVIEFIVPTKFVMYCLVVFVCLRLSLVCVCMCIDSFRSTHGIKDEVGVESIHVDLISKT